MDLGRQPRRLFSQKSPSRVTVQRYYGSTGSALGNSPLFAIGKVNGPLTISGTGDLTLKNVYIKGFHIKGGKAA